MMDAGIVSETGALDLRSDRTIPALTQALRAALLPRLGNIPPALRQRKAWVAWKAARLNPDTGKFAKQPYYPNGRARSGRQGGADDLAQLGTFEEARAALERDPTLAGIGFATLGQFGVVALDADHCVQAGAVREDVARLTSGTYSEISPSGNGVRAFWLGEAPTGHNNAEGFEVFGDSGFVTVTGNRLGIDQGNRLGIDQGNSHELICGDELPTLDATTKAALSSLVRSGPAGDTVARVDAAEPPRTAPVAFDPPKAPLDISQGGIRAVLQWLLDHGALGYRDSWLKIGMALHHQFEGGGDGLELWDDFSSRADGYLEFDDLRATWESFGRASGKSLTFASCIHQARELGMPALPKSGERDEVIDTEDRIVDLAALAAPLPPPPADWIEALIPAGEATLLGAHGGTGKSMLGLLLAVHLATGRAFAGHAVRQGRVLFVSCEDNGARMLHRLQRITRHLGVNPGPLAEGLQLLDLTATNPELFVEERFGGKTTRRYDWLLDRVVAWQADVVIVDNASDTFAANENNRQMVRSFVRALRSLIHERGGAVLLLAHIDKAAARSGGGENYSGSTAWHNSVRSRLSLVAAGDTALTLTHEKSNHGVKAKPITLNWIGSIPVPRGTDPFAEMAESTGRGDAVLALIEEFYRRGEYISPAPTARNNANSTLRGEVGFPPNLDPRGLSALLRDLERSKDLVKEPYQDAARRPRERWALTESGRARIGK